MKRTIYFILFVCISIINFSCDDEHENDPQGTITTTLRMNTVGLDDQFIFFGESDAGNVSKVGIEPIVPSWYGRLYVCGVNMFNILASDCVVVHTFQNTNNLNDITILSEDESKEYDMEYIVMFQEKSGYFFQFKKDDKTLNVRLRIEKIIFDEEKDEYYVKIKYHEQFQ